MGLVANSARTADPLAEFYGGGYGLIVMALEVVESDDKSIKLQG